MMCEPLPGAGEWGRTRALHPCCAVAWEHSAPAKGLAVRHKNSQAGHGRLAEGEKKRIKCRNQGAVHSPLGFHGTIISQKKCNGVYSLQGI